MPVSRQTPGHTCGFCAALPVHYSGFFWVRGRQNAQYLQVLELYFHFVAFCDSRLKPTLLKSQTT